MGANEVSFQPKPNVVYRVEDNQQDSRSIKNFLTLTNKMEPSF